MSGNKTLTEKEKKQVDALVVNNSPGVSFRKYDANRPIIIKGKK